MRLPSNNTVKIERDSCARRLLLLGAVVATMTVACGGSGAKTQADTSSSVNSTATSQPTPTTFATASATSEVVPTTDITLKSPVQQKPTPTRYTCDGADQSPPISWSRMPSGTAEVDVFILSSAPVKGKYLVVWGLTAISPKLHGLQAGRLPSGAVVGRNSAGQARYHLCPAKGTEGNYAILVYAVPRHFKLHPGFDVEQLVEHTLLNVIRHEGETFFSYRRS